MLILLVRVIFIVLAVLIGLSSGQVFFDEKGWMQHLSLYWGGILGLAISVTLIAAENAFRRHFTRSLVAFLIGLGAGLALSWISLAVLRQVVQDHEWFNSLAPPLVLVVTYLVLSIILRHADHFRVVIPFVEFRAERLSGGVVVVDATALADSRLVALVRAGLLPHRMLVHRRVLMQCEEFAASTDAAVAVRGRRALEGLAELRTLPSLRVEIEESEIPNAATVSEVLTHLTRLENARLLVGEPDAASRAAAEGIPFIDLTALAASMSQSVRPGEILNIRIEKLGEGRSQGIGYLADGSIVIVSDAADLIGQMVACTVLRLHATNNGRMIFAQRVIKEAHAG
jgi:uncharacterized protein YacL